MNRRANSSYFHEAVLSVNAETRIELMVMVRQPQRLTTRDSVTDLHPRRRDALARARARSACARSHAGSTRACAPPGRHGASTQRRGPAELVESGARAGAHPDRRRAVVLGQRERERERASERARERERERAREREREREIGRPRPWLRR